MIQGQGRVQHVDREAGSGPMTIDRASFGRYLALGTRWENPRDDAGKARLFQLHQRGFHRGRLKLFRRIKAEASGHTYRPVLSHSRRGILH